MAEVDAARIDALWACYDGHAEACIAQPDVVGGLVARYCDALKRAGSVEERDSVINQMRFLIETLQQDQGGTEGLIEAIEKCPAR